jgi:hypothetical protein
VRKALGTAIALGFRFYPIVGRARRTSTPGDEANAGGAGVTSELGFHATLESGRFEMRKFSVMTAVVVALFSFSPAPAMAGFPEVQVYKSPTCGCCNKWIQHLRAHGFTVKATDVKDVSSIKRQNGIPSEMSSCHTAFVGGYVVEGHVPAGDVIRLLTERPKVSGLAVPKMPVGSPGMEGPKPVAYDVLSFDAAGKVTVFSHHEP